jgi:ubiquinone/menaquinone biosynthesis C-methylase UbiE
MTQEHGDTRAAWNNIAAGYDKTNTETQQWLGNESVRRAGLTSGMRFLDVAAGSGALSLPAARLGAKVLATDLSPAMLALLRERARRENLDIETRVMDGQHLELDNNTFDIAGSQFGVMTFPDQPRGIREMTRVVKPGGRVVMTVYGSPAEIDFLGLFVGAVHSVRPDFVPSLDPPPAEFRLADPEKLRRELVEAGLKQVQVDRITESTEFKTPTFLWDHLQQPDRGDDPRHAERHQRRARHHRKDDVQAVAGARRYERRRDAQSPGQHRVGHEVTTRGAQTIQAGVSVQALGCVLEAV